MRNHIYYICATVAIDRQITQLEFVSHQGSGVEQDQHVFVSSTILSRLIFTIIFAILTASCAHEFRSLYTPNGQVSVTTFDVGGIATFKCNSGYNLSGSPKRICLSSGFWSGIKPTCNREFLSA